MSTPRFYYYELVFTYVSSNSTLQNTVLIDEIQVIFLIIVNLKKLKFSFRARIYYSCTLDFEFQLNKCVVKIVKCLNETGK